MRIRSLLIISLILCGGLSSCKKEATSNKIISGLPLSLGEQVIPAISTQHMTLLKRDLMQVIIPIFNKIGTTNPDFSELTSVGGSSYTITIQNFHFGQALVTLQFRDPSDMALTGPLDSTGTLKSIVLAITSLSNAHFTYNESLRMALDTAGDTRTPIRLSGTSIFNGSGLTNLTYTFPDAQPAVCAFEGLTGGPIMVAGTNTNGNVSMSLIIATDHTVSGSISWDGIQGGISIKENGTGVLVTDTTRYLIE